MDTRGSSGLVAVLASAALALGSAGCGGSDDTASTPAGGDSRSDFIAAADAICAKTGEEINAETVEFFPQGTAPSEKDLEELFAEVTIPALARQYEEIAALPVPEGDEEEVEALLAAADEAIAQAEKDPASLLVLQGADTPFSEVNRLSTEYGLEVCGSAEES